MKVQEHGSYPKLMKHMLNSNMMGSEYRGCNKSYVADNAHSKGQDGFQRHGRYYCYNPMITAITGEEAADYVNEDGYGVVCGYSWMDGNRANTYEACTAWHDWLTCPETSPWKMVLKGGDAIKVLRHDNPLLVNYAGELIPVGTPYGYLLAYHLDDWAQPLAHFMIAIRCATENTDYVQSWYNYTKLGFSKIRSMIMAYELELGMKGNKWEVKRGPRVDNFQFFMIDGCYNENRYEQGPVLEIGNTFRQGLHCSGTSRCMAYVIKELPLKQHRVGYRIENWRDHIYRKNVGSWGIVPTSPKVGGNTVLFGKAKSLMYAEGTTMDSLMQILTSLNEALDKDKEGQKDVCSSGQS